LSKINKNRAYEEVVSMAGSRGPRSSLTLAERVVLAAFGGAAAYTRAELAELTGLSRPVIAGIVEALTQRGELVPDDDHREAARTRGRPSARYRRSALLPPVLLIHMRKDNSTIISVVTRDGSAQLRRPADPWDSPWERWAPAVRAVAGDLVGVAAAAPRLAVLSAPFPVREGAGQPRIHALPAGPRKMPKPVPAQVGWLTKDPRPAIAELLGCPVVMINDANLAALGEVRAGAGQGYRGVAYLCVRFGIGVGLVFSGALLTGANGFAGELAHAQVTEDGDFCVCGNRGCLATEVVIGQGMLAALAGIHGPRLTFHELNALIKSGNPVLQRYFKDLGSAIGRPMATVTTVLDPDCIVVDGSLEEAVTPFIAGLSQTLAQRCPPAVMSRLAIVPGALGNPIAAGALAAADIVAQSAVTQAQPPFTPVSPSVEPRQQAIAAAFRQAAQPDIR
jgi:predicted NBD/HSP70 family sugar kinase